MDRLPDTLIGTMDDVAYDVEVPHVNEPDPDAYRQLLAEYQSASLLKDLPDLPAFQELMKVLEARARRAAEQERSYQGLDTDRVTKLRLERIKADATLNVIRNIVSEATLAPLPEYK